MTELIDLTLKTRTGKGKGVLRRLRKEGEIPAVFYGPDYKEAISVTVNNKVLLPYLKSGDCETVKFKVALPNGNSEICIMRDVQRNPLDGSVLHIDFYQLKRGRKVSVNVPIKVINKEQCPGIKAGGVLGQILHDLEMDVLPIEMPEAVVVDVKDLQLGQSVLVRDLSLPDSAEIMRQGDEPVVEVVLSKLPDIEEASSAETETETVAETEE